MKNLRCVTVRGVHYLRIEDVAEFIRELGGSEETDVRWRHEEAASYLLAASKSAPVVDLTTG
jgi:hypothetical protein